MCLHLLFSYLLPRPSGRGYDGSEKDLWALAHKYRHRAQALITSPEYVPEIELINRYL